MAWKLGRLTFALALMAMTTAACAQATAGDVDLAEQTRKKLSEKLLDPFSAQFRELREFPALGASMTCGKVNAKNSFGAYVGFKEFVITGDLVVIANSTDPGVQDASLKLIAHLCTTYAPKSPAATPG